MSLIAFPNELLQEHLENVTKEILARFLSKRSKLMFKLLKPYTNIDLEIIKHAILYAGIFHDVGKAYDYFQKTLRQRGKAPRHEVFSVFFLDRVLTKIEKNLKTIVLLAIAWHHSSTRGAILERIGGTMRNFLPVDSVRLDECSKRELLETFNNIFLIFGCGEEIVLQNIPEIISVYDAEKLLDELGRCIRSEKKNLYKTYFTTLPLLTALQIADIKVAFENRKTTNTLPVYIKDITSLDSQKRIIQILKSL